MKCWFAHGREELRSVPRLDRHPEAALNAVNQVIESLPPSRSRKGLSYCWISKLLITCCFSRHEQKSTTLSGTHANEGRKQRRFAR